MVSLTNQSTNFYDVLASDLDKLLSLYIYIIIMCSVAYVELN